MSNINESWTEEDEKPKVKQLSPIHEQDTFEKSAIYKKHKYKSLEIINFDLSN